MSTSGRRDDAGPEEVEEETADAKIERMVTEIDELKASLIGVPELSSEWFQIKTDIKDRDIERLVLIEKKRCDDVVKDYFEENPRVVEAVPECPVCLEKMWDGFGTVQYVCCGKEICKKCDSQGGDALDTCPLCRGKAPGSLDEMLSITREKADSGFAWAQADMGKCYLYGNDGVQQDEEKALSLLSEAAEKGCARANANLGLYYFQNTNHEEARQWLEAGAAEGEMFSLFQLGMMMKDGHAFDQNEETRAEAFRLITISTVLLDGLSIVPAVELSFFFLDCLPVMLHYLRPAVEGGKASLNATEYYAQGLVQMAIRYYGIDGIMEPGYCPVSKALFWHWQCSRKAELSANHPLVRLERDIRKYCAQCRADLSEGKPSCCVECKAAYYCNRDCQVAHWKAGHKKDCVKKLKKRLKAAGTPFVEP